jgi:phosphotransacetylase
LAGASAKPNATTAAAKIEPAGREFSIMDQTFFMDLPVKDYAVADCAVVDYGVAQSKIETARQNGLDFLWVK